MCRLTSSMELFNYGSSEPDGKRGSQHGLLLLKYVRPSGPARWEAFRPRHRAGKAIHVSVWLWGVLVFNNLACATFCTIRYWNFDGQTVEAGLPAPLLSHGRLFLIPEIGFPGSLLQRE